MKKFICAICVMTFFILTLSGCGSIPDMTEDQEDMVSEYAVSLLLKYDAANHSRLVNVDKIITSYETAKKIHDDAEAAYYQKLQEEEEKRKEEASMQDELNNNSQNDTSSSSTTSSSSGGNGSGGRNDGTGGAVVVDNTSVEDFLGISGFSIVYAGFDVMNDYPEESMDFVPYISASEGGDLCIVYFNVTNTTSGANTLDIINMVPMTYFKLSVNGDNFKSVVRTILDDDLAVYEGNFAAGETKRLVLIAEVKEGTVIDTLNLRITQGSGTLTKSLR